MIRRCALIFCVLFLAAGCSTVLTRDALVERGAAIKRHADASDFSLASPMRRLPKQEKLIYKVRYLGMTIGEVVAEIRGMTEMCGRPAYHFVLTAKTDGFFSKIFKAESTYISYMDVEKLHVLRHEEYRREGSYRKDAVIDFDYEHQTAHCVHLINGEKKTFAIRDGLQDGLTAVYYFRMLPLEVGDTMDYQVNVNEDTYDLFGLIMGRRVIDLPNFLQVESFELQPYADLKGQRVQKGRLTGHFTTDERRIPLRADVRTPIFGSASVFLHAIVDGDEDTSSESIESDQSALQ